MSEPTSTPPNSPSTQSQTSQTTQPTTPIPASEKKVTSILVFEFDELLFQHHSKGRPFTNKFMPSDENIKMVNDAITSWLSKQDIVVIVTRCIQSELVQWFQRMINDKKFTFSISTSTQDTKGVLLVAPPDILYKAHLNETNYWAIWKADRISLLLEEYPNRPMFLFDTSEVNLYQIKIQNPMVHCILVDPEEYKHALSSANDWLDMVDHIEANKSDKLGTRNKRYSKRKYKKNKVLRNRK